MLSARGITTTAAGSQRLAEVLGHRRQAGASGLLPAAERRPSSVRTTMKHARRTAVVQVAATATASREVSGVLIAKLCVELQCPTPSSPNSDPFAHTGKLERNGCKVGLVRNPARCTAAPAV